MVEEIECTVTGRVQMVMFRDFTQRKARRLGLIGEVENLSDGSVRIVAQGEKDALNTFIEEISKGPVFAKVGNIHIVWRETKGNYEEFKIVY